MENPKEEYKIRQNNYFQKVQRLSNQEEGISHLRLFIALLGIGIPVLLYIYDYSVGAFIVFIFSLVTFIFLIIKHENVLQKKQYFEALSRVNENSLKRLSEAWKSFEDQGKEFIDENHSYVQDLDIFGKASLFQWINVANTYMGRQELKALLTDPCKKRKEMIKRQEAIRELGDKIEWRQDLQAQGMILLKKQQNPNELIKWSETKNIFSKIHYKQWVMVLQGLPVLTLAILAGTFLFHFHIYYILLLGIIQLLILGIGYKKITDILHSIGKYQESIKVYQRILKLIEEEKFHASYLRELQGRLKNKEQLLAFQQIAKLEKIIDMLSLRYSQLYIFFNILTLWDYQCVIALEKWKEKYGQKLFIWLEVIGEIEALSSLALLSYDHPQWAIPEIREDSQYIAGENMGHPLLLEEIRVNNSIQIEKPKSIILITGSNMSGKSTFLRTIGINLVLAYAGAPVCAKGFECSIMDIYTSMRVRDDLEQSISSFYAQLIRIKKIIEATEKEKPIFFLLDEIFKGTNSKDRHTGAKMLIKKLSMKNALGLISTHDLELGELEEKGEYRVRNYHFQEFYKENKIDFDYRLRPGISKTFNAIYLMKQIGIDI